MPTRGRGFYLNVLRPKHGGVYARLAQSYWDQGHVKTRVLQNFGRVTLAQLDALHRWVDANPLYPGPTAKDSFLFRIQDLHCLQTWQYGREALGHFLWWKLGLHRIILEALNGIDGKARHARWIEALVLNRLAQPSSKYGALRWLKVSATPFLLGLGDTPRHENALYRAMDRLWVRHNGVETRIWERVVKPLTAHPDIYYHDLTSTYFEREPDDFVKFGYSRDKVEGCPQVNWGMVVTPEGFPITCQVYPGNTTDVTTVVGMRTRLQSLFGLEGGIYVGDRGMRSADNVKDLVAHHFHTILAEKVSEKAPMAILEKAAQQDPIAKTEKLVIREVAGEDARRWIVLLNEKHRASELETLEHRRAEGEAILKNWRKRVGDTSHHEILKGCQQELSQAGLLSLFDIGFDEYTFQGLTSEMKAAYERKKQWAGWWVLSTDTELPAKQVAEIYQGLAIIERGWREIKSVLDVRPVHHTLQRRISAHLVLCELAYLVERYAGWKVRSAGVMGEDGPLTGPGAFEAMGSMVVNDQEIVGTGVRFKQVTEPNERQRRILETLGLKVESFQRGWSGLDPERVPPKG